MMLWVVSWQSTLLQFIPVLVWLLFVLWISCCLRFCLLSPCLHWWWFVPFQTWTSCIQRGHNALHLYNKNKNNYRSRWCIHANGRSVCYRQLHISTNFPYTLTSTTYWYYYVSTNFCIMILLRLSYI